MAGFDEYTKVLMHFNESAVKDECGNAWIATGTSKSPTLIDTNAKFGKSVRVDSNNYLQLTSGLTLGGQDFTIDYWANVQGAVTLCSTGGNNFVFQYYNTNFETWLSNSTATGNYKNGIKMSLNEWHHIAVVYSHATTTTKTYIDGVLVSSLTKNLARSQYSPLCLGKTIRSAGSGKTAYIDEFRISDGIARWTSDFTPPARPYSEGNEKLFLQVGEATKNFEVSEMKESAENLAYFDNGTNQKFYIGAVKNSDSAAGILKTPVKNEIYANAAMLDPFTKVLLHFDETAVKDECGADWISLGTSTISATNAKFDKALQLSGANSIKHPTGIFLGGQDFTIDGWIYMSASSGNVADKQSVLYAITDKESTGQLNWLYSHRTAGANYVTFGLLTPSYPNAWENTGVSMVNQLAHFAYVYDHSESSVSLYINGVKRFSLSTSMSRIKVDIEIGHRNGAANAYFVGAVDEFRISDGIARWTENFTPPTKPYSHLFDGVKYPLKIPTLEDKIYTGAEITQVYENDLIEMSGEISGTDVGEYNAIFKLKYPKIYRWE